MSGHRAPSDYDERLLAYITERVKENRVPPTIDEIVRDVEGLASKSTVYAHCQKLVKAGYLTQKNEKGYYYPVSLEKQEVLVPVYLLKEIGQVLIQSQSNRMLAKNLQDLIDAQS